MDSAALGALCLEQDEIGVLNLKALLLVVRNVGHLLFFAGLSVARTELRQRISRVIDALDSVRLIVISTIKVRFGVEGMLTRVILSYRVYTI